MLIKSGETADSRYFDYRPSFFGEVVRIEWPSDTMFAGLQADAADYLIHNGYARLMSEAEVEEYTKPSAPPEPKSESKKGAKP